MTGRHRDDGGRSAEEETAIVRARLLTLPGWVATRFPGVCDRCGRAFPVGAAIRADTGGVRAECCA